MKQVYAGLALTAAVVLATAALAESPMSPSPAGMRSAGAARWIEPPANSEKADPPAKETATVIEPSRVPEEPMPPEAAKSAQPAEPPRTKRKKQYTSRRTHRAYQTYQAARPAAQSRAWYGSSASYGSFGPPAYSSSGP
jgi:hypothetical protein